MKEKDSKSTIKVYGSLLRDNGADSSMGLGWSSKGSQEGRFKALCVIGPLGGCAILDGGCGVGDLYGYLRREGHEIDYCGIDVCPQMVTAARQKHPGVEFVEGDLDTLDSERRFDYVLISGTFNWTISDNDGVAKNGLLNSWRMCRKGIAVNFLSSRDPWPVDYLYYFSPEKMKEFALSFAPRVEMRDDYMSYDFTLYLYKT
jgi:SAM-dependent methyltransferase